MEQRRMEKEGDHMLSSFLMFFFDLIDLSKILSGQLPLNLLFEDPADSVLP